VTADQCCFQCQPPQQAVSAMSNAAVINFSMQPAL